jgi:hypothetical protein
MATSAWSFSSLEVQNNFYYLIFKIIYYDLITSLLKSKIYAFFCSFESHPVWQLIRLDREKKTVDFRRLRKNSEDVKEFQERNLCCVSLELDPSCYRRLGHMPSCFCTQDSSQYRSQYLIAKARFFHYSVLFIIRNKTRFHK